MLGRVALSVVMSTDYLRRRRLPAMPFNPSSSDAPRSPYAPRAIRDPWGIALAPAGFGFLGCESPDGRRCNECASEPGATKETPRCVTSREDLSSRFAEDVAGIRANPGMGVQKVQETPTPGLLTDARVQNVNEV